MKKKDNLISMHGYLSLPVLVKYNVLRFTLFAFICLIYLLTDNRQACDLDHLRLHSNNKTAHWEKEHFRKPMPNNHKLGCDNY